jgi:hypothetical protein
MLLTNPIAFPFFASRNNWQIEAQAPCIVHDHQFLDAVQMRRRRASSWFTPSPTVTTLRS